MPMVRATSTRWHSRLIVHPSLQRLAPSRQSTPSNLLKISRLFTAWMLRPNLPTFSARKSLLKSTAKSFVRSMQPLNSAHNTQISSIRLLVLLITSSQDSVDLPQVLRLRVESMISLQTPMVVGLLRSSVVSCSRLSVKPM